MDYPHYPLGQYPKREDTKQRPWSASRSSSAPAWEGAKATSTLVTRGLLGPWSKALLLHRAAQEDVEAPKGPWRPGERWPMGRRRIGSTQREARKWPLYELHVAWYPNKFE